jgi:hypothetical protein
MIRQERELNYGDNRRNTLVSIITQEVHCRDIIETLQYEMV